LEIHHKKGDENHALRFRIYFERGAKLKNNKEQHIQTFSDMNESITHFQLRTWPHFRQAKFIYCSFCYDVSFLFVFARVSFSTPLRFRSVSQF